MKFVLVFLFAVHLICASRANAAIVTIQEAIIRSGYKSIDLICVVSGLNKNEVAEQDKIVEQINFRVGAESKYIARESGSTDSQFNLDLYWQLNSGNLEAESTDRYRITYNVSIGINNNDGDAIKKLAPNGSVGLRAFFQYKDSNNAPVEGTGSASLFLHNPTEAPKGLSINAIHKGLDVKWEVSNEVKHTDDKNYSVSNVLVMLFKDGESEIDLKANKASSNEEEEPEFSACRYVAGQEECIQCDNNPDNVYISSDQGDQQNNALIFALAKNDKGGFSFNELDPNASYTIALQYQDGTKRTVCKEAKTILSLSLTEANGEEEGKLSDTPCFIATAAFGSPFHKHVEVFRWFRSRVLLKTQVGKKFVSFYYKNSPRLANMIAESEALKSVTRALLIVPAYGLHGLRLLSQNYLLAFGLLAALSTILLGLFQAKKRS